MKSQGPKPGLTQFAAVCAGFQLKMKQMTTEEKLCNQTITNYCISARRRNNLNKQHSMLPTRKHPYSYWCIQRSICLYIQIYWKSCVSAQMTFILPGHDSGLFSSTHLSIHLSSLSLPVLYHHPSLLFPSVLFSLFHKLFVSWLVASFSWAAHTHTH